MIQRVLNNIKHQDLKWMLIVNNKKGKEDDFSIHFGNHQSEYSAEELQQIQHTIVKQVKNID